MSQHTKIRPNCAASGQNIVETGRFKISQNGGHLASCIFKTAKFNFNC